MTTWLAFALGCAEPVAVDSDPGTPPFLPPALLGGCAAPSDGFATTEDLYLGFSVDLSGPVLEAGDGEPPHDCWQTGGFESSSDVDPATASWFTAADADGTVWTAGLVLPGGAPALRPGDAVEASFQYVAPSFAPQVASLTVRDGDGHLLGWAARGGDLPDLSPPDGLVFARGAEVASYSDDCVDWNTYDLDATLAGAAVTVPYGDSARIGDRTVWHGGFDEEVGPSRCPDGFVARVAAAVAP